MSRAPTRTPSDRRSRPNPPRAPTTPPPAEKARSADPVTDSEPMVTLAVITGAHGLGGEVRLKLFTNDLSAYPMLRAGGATLELKALRQGGNGAVARFVGVGDRNAAERLRGTALTIPRSALPPLEPGEYYHADLLGLPAVSTDGEALGHVVAVENFGAGDVIEIEREGGARFMIPMRPEAVPEWTTDRMVVDAAFVG